MHIMSRVHYTTYSWGKEMLFGSLHKDHLLDLHVNPLLNQVDHSGNFILALLEKDNIVICPLVVSYSHYIWLSSLLRLLSVYKKNLFAKKNLFELLD